MRKTFIVGFIISLALTIVASASDAPVAVIDLSRAKSLALDACMKKYSGTDRNALQYCGLTVAADTNDQVVVTVTYLVKGDGKTEQVTQDGYEMTTILQTTYVVKMDCFGKITGTSSGMSINGKSNGRKLTTNQAAQSTARKLADPGR